MIQDTKRKAAVAAAGMAALASGLITGESADAAPITLTASTAYTQNFNSGAILSATSGTSSTLPVGWAFSEGGSNANATYTANNGSSATGDMFSYGSSAAATQSDRALGQLRSGSLVPTIGTSFTNNTGSTITSLTISYNGELWRRGVASRTGEGFDFQYGTATLAATAFTNNNPTAGAGGNEFLSTGTYINPAAGLLDYAAPTGAATGTLSTAPHATTAVSGSITGLSIANGATFYMKWIDLDPSGTDDGFAIDDFSLTPGLSATAAANTVSLTSVGSPASPTLSITGANDSYVGASADVSGNTGTVGITGFNPTTDGPVLIALDLEGYSNLNTFISSLEAAGGSLGFTATNIAGNVPGWVGILNQFSQASSDWEVLLTFNAGTSPYNFNWSFLADTGVSVDRIAVVPEPASVASLGLLAGSMLFGRRRRRRPATASV